MSSEENQRPQPIRHWFQFRLRNLLALIAIASGVLGWFVFELDQRQGEKQAIAWVEEMGGQVISHPEISWWEKTKDKWFGEIVRAVAISNTQVSDISPVAELKNLKFLSLNGTHVSNLSPLAELKKLETLGLTVTQVSDISPRAVTC